MLNSCYSIKKELQSKDCQHSISNQQNNINHILKLRLSLHRIYFDRTAVGSIT